MFVNPAAGGGQGLKLFNRVADAMRRDPLVRGAVASLMLTPEMPDDEPAAVEAMRNCGTALVCGGDGTVHQMVNLMIRNRLACALSVHPIGTGNDFALHLGATRKKIIPRIRSLAGNPSRSRMDVYALNGTLYFANYAGFGLDAWVLSLYAVAIKHLGRLRMFRPNFSRKALYALTGVWAMLFHNTRVTDAEGTCEGVIACNLPYYAGGSIFSDGASVSDGKIELLRMKNKTTFLRLVFSRFLKFLSNGPPALTPPVRLMFEKPPPVQVDGEDYSARFAGCREFTITHAGSIDVAG